jgi:hypothetical protein
MNARKRDKPSFQLTSNFSSIYFSILFGPPGKTIFLCNSIDGDHREEKQKKNISANFVNYFNGLFSVKFDLFKLVGKLSDL